MASALRNSNVVTLAPTALRRKLLGVALHSPEFRQALDEAAKEIRGAAQPHVNEATIESHFERVVYATLREIGLQFNPTKEIGVHLRRHIARGRTDSRLGALVIEYKRPSLLTTAHQREEAFQQLTDYITALSSEEATPYHGILTNGLVFMEVRAQGGMVVQKSGVGQVNRASLLRLTELVVSLALTALTSKNLIRDFCGSDGSVLFETARLLDSILGDRPEPKTAMLRSEWEELFRLAHDDQSQQRRIEDRRAALGALFGYEITDSAAEYRTLFALHTAYALVLKLIAYRVVSDVYFGKVLQDFRDLASSSSTALREFCERLEDGETFRNLGIINLLEGDFFSWYSDKKQWTAALADAVKATLEILARYEEAQNVFKSEDAADLFRDLYQAAVPREVRSSFGEVYTPLWLAEHVLSSAEPRGRWRALDPCCGSGTFLIAAIARLRRESGELPARKLLNEILERVAGIDLHPLGVLTSRIQFFIHVSDLIREHQGEFVIPVFLGDAASVPDAVVLDGVRCLQYRFRTLKTPITITLPVSLAADIPRFMKLMYEYEAFIKEQDSPAAVRLLTRAVSREERRPRVIAAIEAVTNQLVELEANGWDGIWARILSNFLTTACLGRFTAVIGNPPWIDWKNLPAGYRERIKALCIDRGLFSGAGRTGGINLNICALIAHVSMTNWLDSRGTLAFLMPRELAVQASYEGWRRLSNSGQQFLAFHDWTAAGHPFDPIREDFMTFIIGTTRKELDVIPTKLFKRVGRSAAAEWRDLREAESHLMVEEVVAGRIIPGSTAFTFAKDREALQQLSLIAGRCEYIGREGIEFYPQELQLFTYDGPGPRPGTVWLRNIQVAKSKFRVPRRRVPMETRFLYPLVKGPAIRAFGHDYDGLIVPFPYDAADPIRPIPAAQLRQEARLLHQYYVQNRELIDGQTRFSDKIRGPNPGEFYGLARTGPYSFAETYVAFRDNTKWCATVITPTRMPWNEKRRFLFQNHAVSICERSDGKLISLDEAHYVSAIFNSPLVRQFIYASSDERSFKIRPPVFVPLFNPSDRDHLRLVAASKAAHADAAQTSRQEAVIDDAYLAICQKSKQRPK